MPQPPTSSHPVFLHIPHPAPSHCQQLMSTSALGSVYGKKLGLNRTREVDENISRAQASRLRVRSVSEIPSPTSSPSIWVNIGEWVRSRSSRRYTRPGTTMRTGGGGGCMYAIRLGGG